MGRVLELGFVGRNKENFGAVRLNILGVIGGIFLGVCRQGVFTSCWRRGMVIGAKFRGLEPEQTLSRFWWFICEELGANFIEFSEH